MYLSFVLYFRSQIVDGLRSPSAVAVDAITTGVQVRNHVDVRTTSRCLIYNTTKQKYHSAGKLVSRALFPGFGGGAGKRPGDEVVQPVNSKGLCHAIRELKNLSRYRFGEYTEEGRFKLII